MGESLRKSGIDIIGDIPWGTHFCQFYQTKEDLMEILVPYFKAGLENNEFCMWVTSQPLEVEEAKETLRRAVSDFDVYLEKGQIEIVLYTDWDLKEGTFDSENVLNGWVEKHDSVLTNGFDGLRLGNTFWLEKKDWKSFAEYGEKLDSIIGNYQMIALCTYSLDRCNATEIIETVINHQFALIKRDRKWGQIINSGRKNLTECKRVEEMLKESEARLRVLFNLLPVGVSITDNKRNILDANLALESILGFTRSDLLNAKNETRKYLRSNGTEMPAEEFPSVRALKEKGLIQSSEIGIIKEDGSTIWTDVSAIALPFSDGQAVIITRDITESKKTEEKLRNLANIVESSNDAIITKSLDGIITSWNKGAEQIYGYSAKEIMGKPIAILEPSILVEETKELAELIEQGDQIHHYETLRSRKDGRVINVSLTLSPIFDASEKLTAISVIARDITRSKKAEEKLQKSEERYRIATEQTGQVVYEYDLRTDKSTWAGAIEEVTGYSFEEFQKLGKEVWMKNIHLTDMNRMDKKFSGMGTTGGRFKDELRLRKKDGTCIYIENNGVWLTDYECQTYGAVGVLKDISEIKLAIKNLEDNERKYRSFIQNFHGIAFQLDENFVPVFLHGAVEEITGYSEEEFMSRIKWEDIIHPDDLSLILKEEEKSRSSPAAGYEEIEFRIKHRDGRIRWVNEIYQKIQREDGKPEFYQGTIYDTTEKKETENFLANIETARKKEIHHRIKNNLQVISSLLDLQAEKFNNREFIKDSEILEAFRESQDRVISIALIHEELYEGRGTDTLKFSLYLKKLVQSLFQTYRLGNTDTSLNMDLEENIFFDMDIAVPLGIIINELVSNSLKYAFVDRDNGRIQIKLCRAESQESKDNRAVNNNEDLKSIGFILTVSDNGIGMPEILDLENPGGLGIQLVTTLVDQLEGEIELKRDSGTEFTIRFTVAQKKCG